MVLHRELRLLFVSNAGTGAVIQIHVTHAYAFRQTLRINGEAVVVAGSSPRQR
jgi:hypothetical protein